MIAGSILLGRALAPIEQLIGGWPILSRARQGWASLKTSLARVPSRRSRRPRCRRRGRSSSSTGVTVVPPDQQRPSLRNVELQASSPARRSASSAPRPRASRRSPAPSTGIWRPVVGRGAPRRRRARPVRRRRLGSYIGYLPQDVALFDGTVAENIARLAPEPDPDAVVARRQDGRRPRHDPEAARRLRHPDHGRRRPALRRPDASASRWPARSTATRCSWCSTSPTRTSTARAARR